MILIFCLDYHFLGYSAHLISVQKLLLALQPEAPGSSPLHFPAKPCLSAGHQYICRKYLRKRELFKNKYIPVEAPFLPAAAQSFCQLHDSQKVFLQA